MQLDHATIVTADLDSARRFFVDVAGLTEGARPRFSINGYWLILLKKSCFGLGPGLRQ